MEDSTVSMNSTTFEEDLELNDFDASAVHQGLLGDDDLGLGEAGALGLEEVGQGLFEGVKDSKYLRNRPILLFQVGIIGFLVFIKYFSWLTRFKFKGSQVKLLGTLIITQGLLIHQRTSYADLYYSFSVKTLIDALMVASLVLLATLHLVRLNHFIPESLKGEYQLIAKKIMDRNVEELHLYNSQADTIYTNSFVDEEEDELILVPDFLNEPSFFDRFFTFTDIGLQLVVLGLQTANILQNEGFFLEFIGAESKYQKVIKSFGLKKNISLISLFLVSYLNKSKFVGISQVDSAQYLLIRFLPLALHFLQIWRAEAAGMLKFHFE
mmetsp:Transcript_3020/g.5098  ORF Transcript_3020/g.5098 Transcript_3020/m.5098 type:complete len:324 (+) Transcript_3020:23-994(+)